LVLDQLQVSLKIDKHRDCMDGLHTFMCSMGRR